jgi:hypothetical protein
VSALWEKAQPVRALLLDYAAAEAKDLLEKLLSELWLVFGADLSFAQIDREGRERLAAFSPEPLTASLPPEFFHRLSGLLSQSSTLTTFVDRERGWGLGALVCAFLPGGDGSRGIIGLGNLNERSYAEAELFLLQALAREIGWALRNLYARLGRHRVLHEQQILQEFLEDMSTLELNPLLKKMTQAAIRHLGGDFCTVRLLDERGHFQVIAMTPEIDYIAQHLLATEGAHITPLFA